jgi:hypothetical protein
MREDVQKALEQARALTKPDENNTSLYNAYLSQMEKLCDDLPPVARPQYMKHLAHEGFLNLEIDLTDQQLLSFSLLVSNTYNGLHAVEILRARDPQRVAQIVESHTVKTYVQVFGVDAIDHLAEDMQALAKRQRLESDMSL